MLELKAKTGVNEESIQRALQTLTDDKYIVWEKDSSLDQVVILEGWERNDHLLRGKRSLAPSAQNDLSYWTDH